MIFGRSDIPSHVFNVPELDFSGDLFVERLAGPWFRLGGWTVTGRRDGRDVEDVVMRQSVLLKPRQFTAVFDKLESVGNVLQRLGAPGGEIRHRGNEKQYRYNAFHRFEFPFSSVVGEPVVFLLHDTSGAQLFINPDLLLFLNLEEKTRGNGIWWDPRRGLDAVVRRTIDQGNLETVEIRTDYLVKYLQARQMSLLVGHYRHLHLFAPSQRAVDGFVEGDFEIGSPKSGAKAILQNWGLRKDAGRSPFLQRRLHLWFEIKPRKIDVQDPWALDAPFDAYSFTLPTGIGAVAPARWKHLPSSEGRNFEGGTCDFMTHIYFRQEVLMKYQGASGFEILDNGSVRSRYWGLDRSTFRVGNELLSTAIGDFAECVPFEEWPHWKQYAVEPPSSETSRALTQELAVPTAVNSLVEALERLNGAFSHMAGAFRVGGNIDPLWRGSLDSLAGRQLKWIYPATADDDEFLKRATLASTLFLEGLYPPSLRTLLRAVSENLHQSSENKPLGSRNLSQRVTLMALLVRTFEPQKAELPTLLMHAEARAGRAERPDLQSELEGLHKQVRDEFAPLAFLYDLRNHGGLAHVPNKEGAATAAAQLGFPRGNWHRIDYLRLLDLVAKSVHQISEHLEAV